MSDFSDAFEAGTARDATLILPDDAAHALVQVPSGASVHSAERLSVAPWRRRAAITVDTPDAFCAYLALYRDTDSIVFVERRTAALTAIVDYHGAGPTGAPRFGEHRVTLKLAPSPEWLAWLAMNGKKSTQVEFAEFLEEHTAEILEPAGALVLEVATTLEAKREASFASAVVLTSGAHRFRYDESIHGTTRSGEVAIPDVFVLALRPFEGAAPFKITARFRYRVTGSGVSMWFALTRVDDVIRAAFDELVTGIREALPNLRLVAGAPPSAASIVPDVKPLGCDLDS